MSNAKHTPGPWGHGTHMRQTTLAAHERISMPGACAAGVWSMGCDRETVQANARLIAAAPDLLEALQYAVGQVPELGSVPGIAAIAKAKGE